MIFVIRSWSFSFSFILSNKLVEKGLYIEITGESAVEI